MKNPAHELPGRLQAAAAAIANARGARRGAPAIANILEILPKKQFDEVVEDAQAALDAAWEVEPIKLSSLAGELEDPKQRRIRLCAAAGEELGSQAVVLLDVAAVGVVTVSTWARKPGTPARAIAEWANGLWLHAVSVVPFRTVFGWGNGGLPLPLNSDERASLGEAGRASLGEAGRAYADRNSQEPTP